MQSALIIALMFLSALAKLFALLRIAISRLASRYPLFTLLVLFSAIRSIVLLAVGGWHGKLHPYLEIWNGTQGITFALEGAACTEAFWKLAFHFRNVKIFGTIVFSFIAIMAVGLSYSLVAIWTGRWESGVLRTAILMEEIALASIVVALLSYLFFRQFPSVPIRPNATRHLYVLVLLFGSQFASAFFAQSSQRTWVFLSNVLINVANLTYAVWAVVIRPSGEELPFPAPAPLSPEEFNAHDAQDRIVMQQTIQLAQTNLDDLKRRIRS